MRRSSPVFLVLFFISGASALIYELAWTRLFTVVLGNTVFSVSAILTVFMAGLAAGSRLAGRIIDQRRVRLIRTYAALEAAIGLYNLALPSLLRTADPLFAFVYSTAQSSPSILAGARLALSCALLIVPATLMGATLPILVRYYVDKAANAGSQAGRVYGANTIGAAVGAAAAGFVLIPFAGVMLGLIAAATLNLGVALVAWLAARRQDAYSMPLPVQLPEMIPSNSTGSSRILLLGMFLSGAAALMNEVGWTRVLALVLGPTTYAFTLMLCAMITGLGLGAAAGSYWTRRFEVRLSTFAWMEVFIAVASLAMIPALGRLPISVAQLVIRYSDSFMSIQILEFLLMFGLMLVPTTLLGMTFPVACKLYVRSERLLGSNVSAVYAANTFGGIAGSLVAGFALIPVIGSQRTLILAAALSTVAGVAVAGMARQWKPVALAIALIPCILLIPKWNPELMASGAYKYAPYMAALDLESVLTSGTLLYFKEGASATVSAKKYRGRVSLSIDGKVDATDAADMLTQKMLAHLPLLVSSSAKNVAIIGLGSGVTAGAALTHSIEKLDVLEISPEVVEASRFFTHVNHNALMDPRTRLIIGDGRNHLRYIRSAYDVIISEPSNPWMAGIASLFTREFFNEARSRLAPSGIFCQWLHSYNMPVEDLRTIIGTFRTAFPHAMLWGLNENDFLLLGSTSPLVVDEALVRENFAKAATDLREVRVQDVHSILSLLMLRGEELAQFAKGATLNTDDLPILEFRTPRFIHTNTAAQNFTVISSLSHPPQYTFSGDAHRHKAEMYLAAEAFREAREEFQRALRANPQDHLAWKGLVETALNGYDPHGLRSFLEERLRTEPTTISRLAAAEFFANEGSHARAIEILDAILLKEPDLIDVLEMKADALAGQNSSALAEIANRLLVLEPKNLKGLFHLASARLYEGRIDESIQLVKRVLEIDPAHVRARNLLAIAFGQTFQPQFAEAEFLRAIEQAPDDAATYYNFGVFLLDRERIAEARKQFESIIRINPEDAQGFAGMGETFRHEANMSRARTWYRKALRLDPNHPVAKVYGN